MRTEHESVTITGRRKNNEDSVLAIPEHGLYAVADGMGGYEGGEVASRVALKSLEAYCELLGGGGLGVLDLDDEEGQQVARERLELAIRIADREVRRRAVGRLSRMGTTIVCLAVAGEHALLAHVGDSRIYRMREGEVTALTRDHSLLNELAGTGLGMAQSMRLSSIITQALGQGSDAKPDLSFEDVLPGDRFLLCSDGLSDVLDEEAIAWNMASKDGGAQALVDAAFAAGSRDNISAVVVSVHAD